MKGIRSIYRSDMKQIFSNRAAGITILVLCILPALYAWFYLKSSRDPYGQTQGIKVAVVNKDQGTIFKERAINIWAKLVEELKENQNIGRVFLDEKLAQSWVQNGAYYASIVIGSDFSEKLTSLLDEIPQNPQLLYTVNEKLNAIVPKITDKGASSIKDNIQKAFIDTVNQVVMEKLNEVWLDLKDSKANVYSMINFFHDFRKVVDRMDQKVNTALAASYRLRWKLEQAEGKIPSLQEKTQDAQKLLSSSAFLSHNTLHFIDMTIPQLKDNIQELKENIDNIDYQIRSTLAKADRKSEQFSQQISSLTDKLFQTEKQLNNKISDLQKTKKLIEYFLPHSKLLTPFDLVQSKLSNLNNHSKNIRSTLGNLSQEIEKGIEFWQNTQQNLEITRQHFKTTIQEAQDIYQTQIEPYLQESLQELRKMAIDGYIKMQELENKIPDLEQDINNGRELIDTEIQRLKDFQQKLPQLQASVRKVDQKFQKMKTDWVIDDFIQIASLNPIRFAEFMAEPVHLLENRLFAIPNYGSAMSPFFTTLAIRVGSLLLVSLLTTKVKSDFSARFSPKTCFLGKGLVFLSISRVQALVVSLWDLFLLDVYVADKAAFVLGCLVIATTFSMIIYATVSSFGNGGKALAILLLVLQLSWAGGTFPIELSGSFFQNINPRLPFTYAINAMREAVGGIFGNHYLLNILILWGFWGTFLLIGLYLKPLLSSLVQKFEKKFHDSQLGEH